MTGPPALMVMAKAPAPGRAKTRLTPPLAEDDACRVAWACLLDTLDVVVAVPAARPVLVLDGRPGPWVPAGVEVVAQRGGTLGDRLAAAFADVGTPAVVIAMDTPQVGVDLLSAAVAAVGEGRAVLGPACDGGYWLLGLPGAVPPGSAAAVFEGVPMSTPATGAAQAARLAALGHPAERLAMLADVDDVDALRVVAAAAPGRRVAAVAAELGVLAARP